MNSTETLLTESTPGVGDQNYFERFYSTRSWRDYQWLLALVVKWSRPGDILDVGAGLGFFVEAAAAWGLPCRGIEGSRSAIDLALRRVPHLQLQHHLLQRTLPFPDASFQTVVCNEVIEHLGLETATSLLAETRRILKFGGKLILFSPNAYNRREALADPTHLYCFRPSELRRLLLASGFRSVVSLNSGRPLLGTGVAAARFGNVAFRLTHFDWLSASSNFVAET